MTSPIVTAALLALGVALCAGGYLFLSEAFSLLGLLAGLSIGVFGLGIEAIPGQWDFAVLVVAPLAGLLLARWIQAVALVVFGAAIGFAIGWVVAGISVPPVTNLIHPVLAVAVVLGIVAASFVETPVVMVASASWGAALLTIVFDGRLFQAGTPGALLTSGLPTAYWIFLLLGLGSQSVVWYYRRTVLDDDQTLTRAAVHRLRSSRD